MPKSLNDIDQAANMVLVNYPIDVEFAGFRSDTQILQSQGWDLAIETNVLFNRSSYDVRMALRHEQLGLYGLTSPMELDYHSMAASVSSSMAPAIEYFKSLNFYVAFLSPRIKFQIIPQPRGVSFKSFDATPHMIPQTEVDMGNMGIFRPLNSESDIYLPERTIAELMDEIIAKQKPKQDAIRERQQKMERRLELNEQLEGSKICDYRGQPIESRKEIRAQLIAI